LLDLFRFAFIQRGSVLFWMHVRPENERAVHVTAGCKNFLMAK
jgi:hypothetical protein